MSVSVIFHNKIFLFHHTLFLNVSAGFPTRDSPVVTLQTVFAYRGRPTRFGSLPRS